MMMSNEVVRDEEMCHEGKYRFLVNGAWRSPQNSNYISINNPSNNELIGSIPMMDRDEVHEAIMTAKMAQKAWAHTPLTKRAEILLKAADLLEERAEELGTLVMKEVAKKKSSAIDEVRRTADLIRFTAEEGRRLNGELFHGDAYPGFSKNKMSLVNRVPLGVILAISPFNYPINLSASKIAPALVTGNAVVFKPATQGAISALHLSKVFQDAGLPDGVLNTVLGRGSEIGDYLVEHPEVSMVNYTGSTLNGRKIAKMAGMIPLVMELGGKDAAIVLPDADLDLTATQIVSGAFSYSGQRCTAVKRILALENIADDLIAKLIPLIEKLKVGSPEDNCDITPLISMPAADFVTELVDDAIAKGAKVCTGGQRNGSVVFPTLLDHVTEDMKVAWEEPFGPVLPIIRVQSVEEAIDIANRSEYGLQSSIFTRDFESAFKIAEQLEVGSVQINGRTERGPDHFPFVGVKSSGTGAQGVVSSLISVTRPKSTILNFQS